MPDPDWFHLPKETSIGQKLARWIEKCFQLKEMLLVTKWGRLKSNLFSMEKQQILDVSNEQAILVSEVLTYMSFSKIRVRESLLLHERCIYKAPPLTGCGMQKNFFTSSLQR